VSNVPAQGDCSPGSEAEATNCQAGWQRACAHVCGWCLLLLPLQVFVEHAFSSCVRCLATDADSDVVWAGDESGRLAVFRWAGRAPADSLHAHCQSVLLLQRCEAFTQHTPSWAQTNH
jgi:hypothetical protein